MERRPVGMQTVVNRGTAMLNPRIPFRSPDAGAAVGRRQQEGSGESLSRRVGAISSTKGKYEDFNYRFGVAAGDPRGRAGRHKTAWPGSRSDPGWSSDGTRGRDGAGGRRNGGGGGCAIGFQAFSTGCAAFEVGRRKRLPHYATEALAGLERRLKAVA